MCWPFTDIYVEEEAMPKKKKGHVIYYRGPHCHHVPLQYCTDEASQRSVVSLKYLIVSVSGLFQLVIAYLVIQRSKTEELGDSFPDCCRTKIPRQAATSTNSFPFILKCPGLNNGPL